MSVPHYFSLFIQAQDSPSHLFDGNLSPRSAWVFFEDRQCAKTPELLSILPMGECLSKLDPPLLGLFEKNKSSRGNPIVLSEEKHAALLSHEQEVLSNTCWYGRYKKNVIKYVPQFRKKIVTSTVTRHKRTPTHIVFSRCASTCSCWTLARPTSSSGVRRYSCWCPTPGRPARSLTLSTLSRREGSTCWDTCTGAVGFYELFKKICVESGIFLSSEIAPSPRSSGTPAPPTSTAGWPWWTTSG